jgi:hypothetical protein
MNTSMNYESLSERLSGPLALCCAIAVLIAVAIDLESEFTPAVGTVVEAAP